MASKLTRYPQLLTRKIDMPHVDGTNLDMQVSEVGLAAVRGRVMTLSTHVARPGGGAVAMCSDFEIAPVAAATLGLFPLTHDLEVGLCGDVGVPYLRDIRFGECLVQRHDVKGEVVRRGTEVTLVQRQRPSRGSLTG
jgi:hypothetical protein